MSSSSITSGQRGGSMFFELGMRQQVLLKPRELLADSEFYRKMLVARLLEDANKLGCTQERGHIVAVTTITDVSDGTIRADTGSVVYQVDFNAIVCYLHLKEVVEALVVDVGYRGCSATCGPCPIYLPVHDLVEFQFKPGRDASCHSYRGSDGTDIRIGSIVRVEISKISWNSLRSEYHYIATMARHFCGLSPAFDEFGAPIRRMESPAFTWDGGADDKAADTEDGEDMEVDEEPQSPARFSGGGDKPVLHSD